METFCNSDSGERLCGKSGGVELFRSLAADCFAWDCGGSSKTAAYAAFSGFHLPQAKRNRPAAIGQS
jgi:hypothetical protein